MTVTQGPPDIAPKVAQRILTDLPVAVIVADLNGRIVDCNPRASRIYSQPGSRSLLTELEGWQPRNGTLTAALCHIACSSNWVPIALSREGEHIEMRGRGILLEGYAEPQALLMETHATPQRFAKHSEQVRRLNAQLLIQRETEDRLRLALRTADELRRELVHRVKNNLAIVSALLRTKARAAEHPAATEALSAAAARIRSIAIVHDMLDARNGAEILTSKALFNALLEHLQDSLCPPHVTLDGEISDFELSSEIALPLCLLVNELVTNAIKHAFTNRSTGRIRVVFALVNERFQLAVTDNGSGIDGNNQNCGSGSRIVEALVQQLKGEIKLEQNGGTTWTVTLPPMSRASLIALEMPEANFSSRTG